MKYQDDASPDANVEAVRKMLLERSQVGLKKYGVTTERKDILLGDWLQHLQDALCDAAVYAEAQKQRAYTLDRLYRMMYSYNPDLPMGAGMKAQFLELMEELE